MINLENLTKVYQLRGHRKTIVDNVSIILPTGASVGLLGRNGAGKSTLLNMIAGTTAPTSGYISSDGTISWPVGFAGSFHGELTGAQNVRFVARIYGVDSEELVDFVQQFAKLGNHFREPFRTYSSGMKSRLAFGASMGIGFGTYLVDEVTSVGDAAFREQSIMVFQERMRNAGAVVVSHSMPMIQEMCDVGIVLEQGKLYYYDELGEAIEHHERNMVD